jgi:subtilisin family serine protease
LQGGGLSGATAGPGTAVAAAPRSGGRLFSPRRPAPLTARTTPAPTGAITGELNEREVIVAVPLGRTSRDDAALAADQGLTMISAVNSRLLGRRIVRYAISGTRTVTEVLTALSQDGRVVSVQPNYVFRIIGAAGTKLPAPQYAPDKIGLAAAHKLARGRRVKVAVIDTALDPAHPELKGAIAASLVAIDGPVKPEAHGTAIAGVAGARGTLAGIAPEAALLPVAAFRSSGAGAAQSTTYALVQGIEWSHGQGARVVNMSFAGPEDALLGEFIAAASARGAIFVAAAGNAGPEAEPAFPAAFPHVIAVTATDDRDVLYKDANRGAYIAIAAPGVDILAPGLSGTYELSSGTSLAAAHVSGLAALMLERKPSLTTTKVRAMLARTARMPGSRPAATEVGAGIIDAAGAVGSAR